MPRRLMQLKAVLSFLSGVLCDGAISRLGESAFVFLLSWLIARFCPKCWQRRLYWIEGVEDSLQPKTE